MSHKRAESAGKRRKQWTAERFVAAKMANICWNFIHMFNIPQEYKQAAEYCLDQFDASGAPSLQNPICAAELERRFFPKTERANGH